MRYSRGLLAAHKCKPGIEVVVPSTGTWGKIQDVQKTDEQVTILIEGIPGRTGFTVDADRMMTCRRQID